MVMMLLPVSAIIRVDIYLYVRYVLLLLSKYWLFWFFLFQLHCNAKWVVEKISMMVQILLIRVCSHT